MGPEIVAVLLGVALALLARTLGYFVFFGHVGAGPETTTELARPAPFKLRITWLDVIYAIAMLVGILAKEVWDSLNETGQFQVRVVRIALAFIVSPIIYASVYSRFVQDELTILGLALAFQNGFFWQAVFRSAAGQGAPSPSPSPTG